MEKIVLTTNCDRYLWVCRELLQKPTMENTFIVLKKSTGEYNVSGRINTRQKYAALNLGRHFMNRIWNKNIKHT